MTYEEFTKIKNELENKMESFEDVNRDYVVYVDIDDAINIIKKYVEDILTTL